MTSSRKVTETNKFKWKKVYCILYVYIVYCILKKPDPWSGVHQPVDVARLNGLLAVTDDLEEVLVAHEIEAGEGGPLALEVVAEGLLDLDERLVEPLQGLGEVRGRQWL